MTGLNTGNRDGKPEEREQEILTPKKIVEVVRLAFDGRIGLDPCAAVDEFGDPIGFVGAERWYDGSLAAPLPQCQDGLKRAWVDRTFVNPPYADLKAWLAKTLEQAHPAERRIAVLCPVRSSRVWWRAARNRARECGTYVELDPFAFVGFEANTIRLSGKRKGTMRTADEVAPMALCLMFFNVDRSKVSRALVAAGVGGEVML